MIEVKVTYEVRNEYGIEVKRNETYLVDTHYFSHAEQIIESYADMMAWRECRVRAMCDSNKEDIIGRDLSDYDTRFYTVRASISSLNEKNGKYKKTPMTFLVCADSTTKADEIARKWLDKGLSDYEILSIRDSAIIDILD